MHSFFKYVITKTYETYIHFFQVCHNENLHTYSYHLVVPLIHQYIFTPTNLLKCGINYRLGFLLYQYIYINKFDLSHEYSMH